MIQGQAGQPIELFNFKASHYLLNRFFAQLADTFFGNRNK
jgi:hypothetical protein